MFVTAQPKELVDIFQSEDYISSENMSMACIKFTGKKITGFDVISYIKLLCFFKIEFLITT